MFTIKYVRFLPHCKYLKTLKTNVDYSLEHKIDKDFFAKNISLTAIVGQNGAGKSSLIDMIFRIVNNVGFCLFHDIHRESADPLVYISGIQADLVYEVNGTEGTVFVRDGQLYFRFGEKRYRFTLDIKNHEEPPKQYTDYKDVLNLSESERFKFQKEMALSFFYTIATNYSIQSFVAQDYLSDECITIDHEDPFNPSLNDPLLTNFDGSWLNTIFHKNDGYIAPLALNPYHSDGVINMATEERLVIQRLSAILIEESNGHPFLPDYHFDKMTLNWKPRTYREKFHSIVDDRIKLYPSKREVERHNEYVYDEKQQWVYDDHKDIDDFKAICRDPDSYAHVILSALRCNVKEDMDDLQVYIRMYVVYKVLSVAAKYPSYYGFSTDFGNIDLAFCSMPAIDKSVKSKSNLEARKEKLRMLTQRVKNDKSHIGLKLRQALNFIRKTRKIPSSSFNEEITYDDYARILGIQNKGMKVEERMEWLPPSIFHTKIYLRKDHEEDPIPLEWLSSGERQFIYLMSTILYHAINLKSIPKNGTRIRYKNLNLILDEVEICFHPEYQRTFIKRLVDLLVRSEINNSFNINVIITTHSPFILSDIPSDNILCLENGEPVKTDKKLNQTFCANVYDLLHNHFFMDQFVGGVAADKVEEIIKGLDKISQAQKDTSNESFKGLKAQLEHLQEMINIIGDQFIRMKLQEKKNSIYKDNNLRLEYELLSERMKEIERKLNKNSHDTN